VAIDATLRAAAARAGATDGAPGGRPIRVAAEDLRRKVREHRTALAIVFVVDNSWSVQAEHMAETVKGITLRLLEDATGRGDRVALIAFRGGVPQATVVQRLTPHLAAATRRLEAIPLTARTPLADALLKGRRLLQQDAAKRSGALPMLVVVGDGLPTTPLKRGGDPVADALNQAVALRRARIGCVFADVTAGQGESLAPRLAAISCGVHLAPDRIAGFSLGRRTGRTARPRGVRA
jgi:Mg-chelatase subunit ChlD